MVGVLTCVKNAKFATQQLRRSDIEGAGPVWILGLAFLLGIVSGLRTFTSLAAIAWGAKLGWIPLESTRLAFIGSAAAVCIASILALLEWIGDKLPSTPSRTRPVPFLARVLSGSLCGACLALAAGGIEHQIPILLLGPLAGAVGSVAGTLGGASLRAVLAQAFGKDLPAALLEDLIALGLAASCVVLYGHL
jgi:uncharacterized membrane protein